MNINKYYINHEIIKFHSTISDEVKYICNEISELENLPTYNKRVISSANNMIIKFIQYDINNLNNEKLNYNDSEIYLINQYLENKFTHPYFLPYIGITNIINFGKKTIHNITTNDEVLQDEYITLVSPMNTGIIMPKYKSLVLYLSNNQDLDYIFLLKNIVNILDLAILIRDKYNIIHCDVKIDNIVVDKNIFYLIDWENSFEVDEMYYHEDRSKTGNTEMYPHYNANSEQFFIYSIGVLITRIIGFHYGVTYTDFIDNNLLHFILSKIPNNILRHYEDLLIHIFVRKIDKIEVLIDKINSILN